MNQVNPEKKKFSFDELLKNPIAFIAPTYPYVVAVLVVLGMYYIYNLNSSFINKTLIPIYPDSLAGVDLPIKDPMVSQALDITMISQASQEQLDAGKKLFSTTCVTCHGDAGKGDGPGGVALNPKPRNFSVAEGWKNGATVSGIYETLQKGIAGGGMVAYDAIPAQDRVALAHYVRTFLANPPIDTDAEIATLDQTYQLTKGTQQPGQIPVASAVNLIITEKKPLVEKANTIVTRIEELSKTDAVAKLFSKVTVNKNRAVTTLLNSSTWQSNQSDFVAIIDNDLIQNGFSAKVYSLSSAELSELYNFLKVQVQ